VENTEIIALLEALCERPLADETEPAAFQAFCRRAAETLSVSAAGVGEQPSAFEVDRLTAALALVLSGVTSDEARRTVEHAMLRSASARLDVESSVAFIDTIARSPEAAPADLVDDILAAERPPAARARTGADVSGLRTRLGALSWSARRWRLAAACAVLMAAGAASWTAFLDRAAPPVGPKPNATSAHGQPPAADAPVPGPSTSSPPALAGMQACAPRVRAAHGGAAQADLRPNQPPPLGTTADEGCAPLQERMDDLKGATARQRAEAARAMAAARNAAKATSRIDLPPADRARNRDAFSRAPSPTGR